MYMTLLCIDVTTSGFLGDTIVESTNSGLIQDDVSVSPNTRINTLDRTQFKINHTYKIGVKTKYKAE